MGIEPRQGFSALAAESRELPLFVGLDRNEHVLVFQRLTAEHVQDSLEPGAVVAYRVFHKFRSEGEISDGIYAID